MVAGKEQNMLKRYYVNRDSSTNPHQDHEVHCEGCFFMPGVEKRIYLGLFNSATAAVAAARAYYANVDGCVFCCPEAHHH